jgi:hypothetical protein
LRIAGKRGVVGRWREVDDEDEEEKYVYINK